MDYETLTGTKSQERIDREHLDTLALCHFFLGGLTAVFASVFMIHIVIGTMLIHNPAAFTSPRPSAPPVPPPFSLPQMGYLFVTMGSVAVLGGWTLGGLTAYAGRCLKARTKYLFILVMAGLNCAFAMPLGIVLGVFTLVVLLRPSVKALFDKMPARL